MKHTFLIAGARPNFMKVAPIMRELAKHKDKFEAKLIHTGQHYDNGMRGVFVKEFEILQSNQEMQLRGSTHPVQAVRPAFLQLFNWSRAIDRQGRPISIWPSSWRGSTPHIHTGSP